MISRWLEGELSLREFSSRQLGRAPMARPGAARAIVGLLDWRTLERVLGRPSVDALVVDRGREVTGALPRSREDIRRVFAAGHGLVVRRAEMHDDGIAGLASAVAQDLPGEVHVQVFASPAGSRSFGWHYDDEEVFVVQTVGVKTLLLSTEHGRPPRCAGSRARLRRDPSGDEPADGLHPRGRRLGSICPGGGGTSPRPRRIRCTSPSESCRGP